MGKIKFILIGFLALIMVSCDGLFGVENNVGKPIKFGIAQRPTTRTTYSQEYDGRIDWVNGDKVAIYMDWDDGNGYAGIPREGEGIYEVYGIHENGRESHGSIRFTGGNDLKWKGDFSGNDGRAHEYPHTFWSVYPSNTRFANGKFEFSLPSNQNINDVSGLGLAAYERGVYSNTNGEGHVELHYYPMFTTLCVTIDNAANFQIGNKLELSSDDYLIAGKYYVDISKRYNGIEGGDINNVSSTFSGSKVMLFIIPREYEANKLYFSLNGERKLIPEVLHAGYKYNIKITTKEVEVSSRMTDTEAWFLLAILKNNGGGNNCWNDFEDFWKNVYGFKDLNDFNNSGFWNKLNNSIGAANFDEMGELLDEFFPGKLLDSLLTTMSKIEDINLGEGSLASSKKMPDILLSEDFSKMFPNVKTIKLMPQNDITYKFFGLKKLETITLDGGYAVNVTIILQDCASGVTINKGNNKTVNVEIISTNN